MTNHTPKSARTDLHRDAPPVVEIVRLPVSPERIDEVIALLEQHPYFDHDDLNAHRVLVSDQDEIVLVIDWKHPESPGSALSSPAGSSLAAALGEKLRGAPQPAYYMERT